MTRSTSVNWSQHVRYRCRHCQDECINHEDDEVTDAQECRSCFELPDLSTASEGTGAGACPEAQRSEHPGTARECQSRGARPRPAGSGGLSPDPEARAPPPTGGRGNSSDEAPAASERTPGSDSSSE